ncbi:Pre-mRNA-splicing factor of RES complex-domain-containing protein [Obelidium mucronatum]|nr:Pre-mRNA-splicing factor of RES complex-domain-containing protein [Obelidium mucronatum]
MTSKKDLLARYVSAPTTNPLKKKKSKKSSSHSGTVVLVDDDDGFGPSKAQLDIDLDDEDAVVTVAPKSKGFSASSWSVIREGEGGVDDGGGDDEDRTVGDLQKQMEAEGFQVEVSDDIDPHQLMNPNSTRRKEKKRRRTPSPSPERTRKRTPSLSPSPPPSQPSAATTVYRDKQGRLINKEKEEELNALKLQRQQEDEQERLKFKHGLAQQRQQETLSKRLVDERKQKFAVSINDEELNARLKERQHWGDPLAGLKSDSKGSGGRGGASSDRLRYMGHFTPNRFNIEPGYRWDGVDRTNGFELKLAQSKYARVSLKEEAYKWSTEDM